MKTFHKLLLVTVTATALFISLAPAYTSSPVMMTAEEENSNYEDSLDPYRPRPKNTNHITTF